MKKIFSLILSATMISTVASPAMATSWTPSDIDDPNCIDISKLGNKNQIISLPKNKSDEKKDKNVCGCDTCRVDAVTYGRLFDYIDELERRIKADDNGAIKNIVDEIEAKTVRNTAASVTLFTNSARAAITPFLSGWWKWGVNILCGVIMAGGSYSTIVYDQQSRKYKIQQLENENEIENIKGVLKNLQRGIQYQNYKGKNYYFVSMNNNYLGTTLLTDFWRKDDVKDDPKFDDAFFTQVNEYVETLLKKIENGDFTKYKTFKPDTKKLEDSESLLIKAGLTALVTETFEVSTITGMVDPKDVRNFLKNNLKKLSSEDKERLFNIIKSITSGGGTLAATGKFLVKIIDKKDESPKAEDKGTGTNPETKKDPDDKAEKDKKTETPKAGNKGTGTNPENDTPINTPVEDTSKKATISSEKPEKSLIKSDAKNAKTKLPEAASIA